MIIPNFFTLTVKITPNFIQTGTYNAGVLYIYVNDSLYQKQCFEEYERGKHRLVTVRTKGTSDDNKNDIVKQGFVYMKISTDTKTVASYYSLDNQNWLMVRLYKNDYSQTIWVGSSAQCPMDTGNPSNFEDIRPDQNSVSDFRMGN